MEHEILLDVRHLTHIFPLSRKTAVKAVDDVSFQIRRGEIFGLVGESGSGKTTLLNILAALDKPTGGEVLLNGKNIVEINEKEISAFRRENLGFVFQDFNLLDNFSLIFCCILK